MKYSPLLVYCLLPVLVAAQGRPGDKPSPPPPPAPAAKIAPVPVVAALPPKVEPASLVKGRPWTPDDVMAALKAGADHNKIAAAINQDKLVDFYDVNWTRLRSTPEGRRISHGGVLSQAFLLNTYMGAAPWAHELAKAAIAQRRTQTGRLPRPVDSKELRDKVAAGDPEAILSVYLLPEEDRKFGNLPDNSFADLRQRLIEAKATRGFWYVGNGYRNNTDKAKNDPVIEAEYFRKSAEAGDPHGAMKLAHAFLQPGDPGVAPNFAEVEYWLTEAAARGPEKIFEQAYNNPARDLAILYSYQHPLGGPIATSMELATDAELRWARELIRRGGKQAETANIYLDAFEHENRTMDVRRRLAALPPEVPTFAPAEVAQLEVAAKAGDVSAAAKLGLAYATGRGLHQNDARGHGYLRQAAEKGHGPAARTLAWQLENGYGVKKDPAQRVAFLQKAAEAGDASAWGELGYIQSFGENEHGVPRNVAAALVAYQKGTTAGDAQSMFGLAYVTKDRVKFLALLKQSAEAGYRIAQSNLADELLKTDPKAAAEWYQKAFDNGMGDKRYSLANALKLAGETQRAKIHYQVLVEEGMAEPMYELAEMLRAEGDLPGALALFKKISVDRGAYDFRRDSATKAIRDIGEEMEEQRALPGTLPALRKLAKAGDTKAMLQVARLVAPTDKKDAMSWVQWAGEKGDAEAMVILATSMAATNKAGALEWLRKAADLNEPQAMLLLSGELMATDKAAGIELLKKSAAAGNLEAKFRLGGALFQGTELPGDQAGGLKLINESADGGFALAQYEIGRALLTGSPTMPANPMRGIELLKKAAAQNMPQAAGVLGEVYGQGIGTTPANPSEALKWYKQALRLGLTQVLPAIQRLENQLSANEKNKMGVK